MSQIQHVSIISLFSAPLRIIYTAYAFLIFLAMMVMVFPFIMLATLLGPVRGGNLILRGLRVWSAIWFTLVGIRHRNIYRYRPDPKQQYIFVLNHISYLDAAIAVESIRQPFRALGRHDLKRIPVFGWIYRVFVIMVDRGNKEDRARSLVDLRRALDHGISILIFPEGTFNETDQPLKSFYNGAFRIAIETQTPILPVVLLDAWDRMHHRHFFSLTPGPSRSVFLEPIPVEGLTLDDMESLRQRVYDIMEAAMISERKNA
jgi:1-acyl-sn-glycerol-3-phosphate acyltransferase